MAATQVASVKLAESAARRGEGEHRTLEVRGMCRMINFIHINYNGCWGAQQLLDQTVVKRNIDILINQPVLIIWFLFFF